MEAFKVLIVDDEPGMRMGVRRVLRDFRIHAPGVEEEISFQLDDADSAEAALEKIGRATPDLILLDYKLPGMSGLDVLDHLAAHKLHSVAIMITAYGSLETAVSATKRGAHDILAKPFTPEELKSTIRKAASRLMFERQARELAQERRQIRFQFISVLAHELQAPLNAIEGNLQIVRDRSAGADPAVYEGLIERSFHRIEGMRKMIYDLLDLTRIESGRKRRELAALDAVETARRAIETVAAEAARRGITIALDAPEAAPLTADAGELEIIFNNLLTNAIKYNVEGGTVAVRIRAEGAGVRIEVSDTGIGMTAEEAARLFGDFVRIKNAKTRDILGSGLGLSIVQKLAALYEGEVKVESEPDKGSKFTVVLREGRTKREE